MRTAFIDSIIEQARIHPEIFLMVGDLGFSVVEPFAKEFPDRFLNAGIAEQNMTGMAAGLASEGYHVFTYSIANFPTTRCLEQIRNDVCYHGLPVTVVAVGGGLAYGSLGYSHHAVQDYSMMRCLPEMVVLAPGDPLETRACVEWICNSPCASYLRLGKAGERICHKSPPHVDLGRIAFLSKENGSGLLLTTGATLHSAVMASVSKELQERRILCDVGTIPIWSSATKPKIMDQISNYDWVISIEDHLESGGFGSYLREAAGNNNILQSKIRTLALSDSICGMVGSQSYLNKAGGISHEGIINFVLTHL